MYSFSVADRTTDNSPALNHRNRHGETLFIDARNMGTMVDRSHKELTTDDIALIARTYHAWRGEKKEGDYEDQPGFRKAASLDDIKANDYVLTPGRFVGANWKTMGCCSK